MYLLNTLSLVKSVKSSLCDFYEPFFGTKNDFDVRAPNAALDSVAREDSVLLRIAERD